MNNFSYPLLCLASVARFNASPTFRTASINNNINNAAGNQTHQRCSSTWGFRAYPNKVPRLGVVSGNPKPKKESPDSITIFAAKFNVSVTTMSELKLGISCVKIILKCEEPSVLEACI